MKKTGVMFGLNYRDQSCELGGCINDVVLMAELLMKKYGYSEIKVFTDDTPVKPTKKTILEEITKLVAQSGQYSEIFIHYSGHGGQVSDLGSDESDGCDEIIFPLDFRTAGIIKDDDLNKIIAKSKCDVRAVFDSCHSGTILDLCFQVRYGSEKPTLTVNNAPFLNNGNKKIICVSGSIDSEVSYDAYNKVNGKAMGALTSALYNFLNSGRPAIISDMMLFVRSDLYDKGLPQKPIVSSDDVISPSDFFLTTGPPKPVQNAQKPNKNSKPGRRDINIEAPEFSENPYQNRYSHLISLVVNKKFAILK